MRAYEYRSNSAADSGTYRPRHDDDPVWPPAARAYGGPATPEVWRHAGALGLATLRLILPVTLLLVLLGAAYLYADDLLPMDRLPGPLRNASLAVSDLVLPGTWFCIHLTNRRNGPDYASAQLLAALALAGLVALINPGGIDQWVVTMPAITSRAVAAFGVAFLIANFAGIAFFDANRGPRWWIPPLIASFVASFVFSAIYYPVAFAGVYERWTDSALVHFVVFLGMSILLLVPYWMLRSAMCPLNGMNGY